MMQRDTTSKHTIFLWREDEVWGRSLNSRRTGSLPVSNRKSAATFKHPGMQNYSQWVQIILWWQHTMIGTPWVKNWVCLKTRVWKKLCQWGWKPLLLNHCIGFIWIRPSGIMGDVAAILLTAILLIWQSSVCSTEWRGIISIASTVRRTTSFSTRTAAFHALHVTCELLPLILPQGGLPSGPLNALASGTNVYSHSREEEEGL